MARRIKRDLLHTSPKHYRNHTGRKVNTPTSYDTVFLTARYIYINMHGREDLDCHNDTAGHGCEIAEDHLFLAIIVTLTIKLMT